MKEIFVHSLNAGCLTEPRYIQIVVLVALHVVVLLNLFVLVLKWAFRKTSDRALVFFLVVVTIIHRPVEQVVFVVEEEMYTERDDMWAVVEEEYHTVEKAGEFR